MTTWYASATGPKIILGVMMALWIVILGVGIAESFFLDKVVWSRRNSLTPEQNPWVSNIPDATTRNQSYEYESYAYWIWKICTFKFMFFVASVLLLSDMCKRPFIYPLEIMFLAAYTGVSVVIVGSLGGITKNKCTHY